MLLNIGHSGAMAEITAGFWLSAMANFARDGGATEPYSDILALYIGGMSDNIGSPPWSAIDNIDE